MEALSRMLYAIVNRRFLSRFYMGLRNSDELLVSFTVLADDTLIFCEANSDHLRHMCCRFLCFDVVLGLKINLSKLE
jgi:hypothetical protein